MKLTTKLFGFLNRVFNRDPGAVLAMRLSYDGSMVWTVADGVLSTSVIGGSGVALNIDLSQHTLSSLAAFLAAQPGYSTPYVTSDGTMLGLSALTLLDGSKSIDTSNGDHLEAYTSVTWAWMEPVAHELGVAEDMVSQAPRMMSVPTAEGEWLDLLGDYYAVPRLSGESDSQYASRMIASIGKPLGNNVAMEAAINTVTGGLQAKVVDVPAQPFTSPYSGTSYGLFDVVYSIALDGGDTFDTYTERVRAVVNSYRDAGTHMRSLTVSGDLYDSYDTASIADGSLLIGIGVGPEEVVQLEGKRHNGKYRRDGSFMSDFGGSTMYDGGTVYGWNPGPPISFNNSGEDLFITLTIAGVVQPEERV